MSFMDDNDDRSRVYNVEDGPGHTPNNHYDPRSGGTTTSGAKFNPASALLGTINSVHYESTKKSANKSNVNCFVTPCRLSYCKKENKTPRHSANTSSNKSNQKSSDGQRYKILNSKSTFPVDMSIFETPPLPEFIKAFTPLPGSIKKEVFKDYHESNSHSSHHSRPKLNDNLRMSMKASNRRLHDEMSNIATSPNDYQMHYGVNRRLAGESPPHSPGSTSPHLPHHPPHHNHSNDIEANVQAGDPPHQRLADLRIHKEVDKENLSVRIVHPHKAGETQLKPSLRATTSTSAQHHHDRRDPPHPPQQTHATPASAYLSKQHHHHHENQASQAATLPRPVFPYHLRTPRSKADQNNASIQSIVCPPSTAEAHLPVQSATDNNRCKNLSAEKSTCSRDYDGGGGGEGGGGGGGGAVNENTSGFQAYKVITVNKKKYQILKTIGVGGYGKVYKVIDRDLNEWAMKVVDGSKSTVYEKQSFCNELAILEKLQAHKLTYVIGLRDYYISASRQSVEAIMELGEMNLAIWAEVQRVTGKLTPRKIQYFGYEATAAVDELHKYGILHLDIKPGNFVICRGNLKLIDFGLAMDLKETNCTSDNQAGTIDYVSPEMFRGGTLTYACDVWMLACLLFELYFGFKPFVHVQPLEDKQVLEVMTSPLNWPTQVCPSFKNLIKACLRNDPKQRLTTSQIMASEYFNPS